MKGDIGMTAGLGGMGPESTGEATSAFGGIIPWPGTALPAQPAWQAPLLDGMRTWAMAAVAGLCPLRTITGRLVERGLAAWVVPLDRFMRTLCLAAARPLQIGPPDHDGQLRDETRLLTALQALQLRRTGVAREQLCALLSPDCIDTALHAALLLGAALRVDQKHQGQLGGANRAR